MKMSFYPKTYFSINHYDVNQNTCFILMPFKPAYQPVYDSIVLSLDKMESPITAVRADDLSDNKEIIQDIMYNIATAEFVIADLTSLNPNVLYELGLSHALKDDVIIITQKIADVPFDLRHFRCIEYSQTDKGLRLLGTILRKTIEEIRTRRMSAEQSLLLECQVKICAEAVANWFAIQQQLITAIAAWPEFRNNNAMKHQKAIKNIQSLFPAFTGGIYSLDENGVLLASHPIDIIGGPPYNHRQYFKDAKKTGNFVISDCFDSGNRENKIVVLAAPRFDKSGNFIGILDIVLDTEKLLLCNILSETQKHYPADQQLSMVLLDRNKQIIGSSHPETIGTNLGGNEMLKKAIGDATQEFISLIDHEKRTIVFHTQIANTPFSLFTHQDF